MARALKYDIPGPDWRVDAEDLREQGWEKIFAPQVIAPLRRVIDVGFGRGEFIADLAAKDPGAAHLGIEYSHKRVLKLARRLARTRIGNIRLVEGRAENVLEELIEAESVESVWINFPDPWPKKRHHRRRLLRPEVVRRIATILEPGGSLHVATDQREYALFIDEVLRDEPLLENALAPERFVREMPGRMRTAYECEWRAEGRPLHFWHYRRSRGLSRNAG